MTLEQLFKLSEFFQLAYKAKFDFKTETMGDQLTLIAKLIEGVRAESYEAQQHLGLLRDPWKSSSAARQEAFDLSDDYIEELADVQLMLLAVLYWSGCSADKFETAIKAKLVKNATRQDHSLQVQLDKLKELLCQG